MSASDLKQIIAALKEALGPAWDAYVRQQYIIGGEQIAVGVMLAVAVGASLPFCRYMIGRFKEDESCEGSLAIGVSGFILEVIALVPAVSLLSDGIGHLVNPAGYIIQGIVSK